MTNGPTGSAVQPVLNSTPAAYRAIKGPRGEEPTAATETTHSPWCPDRDHVEDDEVHFYTAVWDLYEQRTGRTPIVSAAAVRAAAILLTALVEAPEEDHTE